MGKGYSVSGTQGKIAPSHDRREYTPDNADGRLTKYNKVIIDTPDERKAFNDLFADSIDAVNAKEKRKDRKKSYDYISEIEADDRKEKPFYEYVFQIGNRNTNGVTISGFDCKAWKADKDAYDIMSCYNKDPDRLKLKAILDSEMALLQERYPDFHFWSIIGHDDEPDGTYHYHVRFTPVGRGYAKGMQKRCSLTKALKNMGFSSKGADYGITQWQNDVKDRIAEAMEKEGYHREFMSNEEEHLSVSLYKLEMEKEQLFEECQEMVEVTKKQITQEREAAAQNMRDTYIDMQADIDVEHMFANKALWAAALFDGETQIEQHELEHEKQEADTYVEKRKEEAEKEAEKIKSDADDYAEERKKEADNLKDAVASEKALYAQNNEELGKLIAEGTKLINSPSGVSDDNDLSRKAYMETITFHRKDGTTYSAEEMYQMKLAKEKKAETEREAEIQAYVDKVGKVRKADPDKLPPAAKKLYYKGEKMQKTLGKSNEREYQ